jgi:hypothetical protein
MSRYLALVPLLLATPAAAQDAPCASPATCVPKAEMDIFVKLLQEKKCQLDESPEFELDPIQIIIDKDGRVFHSGADPKPYKLRMRWCNYEVEAEGKVKLIAAMRQPPIWGFRLRPKAYMGILPSEVFYSSDDPREFGDFVDAGVMVDFLYYDWANLNGVVGYRSVGAGVGIDLTENFGVYSGYALTWGGWHHNANLSLSFSFWNP